MTWNLAYAYGIGSEGTEDYRPKPRSHFENTLRHMTEVIHSQKPDILLLQEVDQASARSHLIPELDQLARMTGLHYRDYCESWNHPYVPYPGLKPDRHFGKVSSGGGILSRFPFEVVAHEFLPKPKTQNRIYKSFYLNRYLQTVRFSLPEQRFPFTLMNLHLEAFDSDNRELHLIKVQNRLMDYDVDLCGGDFNGRIQLQSQMSSDFETQMPTQSTFVGKSAYPPADHPDTQALDGFIFRKSTIQLFNMTVVPSGDLSDHLPVMIEVNFRNS